MSDTLTKAERADLREALEMELTAHSESCDMMLQSNARRFQVLLAIIDGNADDAREVNQPASLRMRLGL